MFIFWWTNRGYVIHPPGTLRGYVLSRVVWYQSVLKMITEGLSAKQMINAIYHSSLMLYLLSYIM